MWSKSKINKKTPLKRSPIQISIQIFIPDSDIDSSSYEGSDFSGSDADSDAEH